MATERPQIDREKLDTWLAGADVPGDGPVTDIASLRGGAQNLLYVITRADGTELVLRRPGAHAGAAAVKPFTREARVLGALSGTAVPHPRLHASHLEDDVIGAPFSILEKIDGFMPRGDLPGTYGTDAGWRRDMAFSLIDGAAALAAVDPAAVGLADLSRTGDWHARQVSRYLGMLEGYRETPGYTENESPSVEPVAEWLRLNRPRVDPRVGIVHGDLQFANVMMRHDRPELASIVDWEMASLGDPLLDLAWILTAWREPGDPPGSDPQLRPWDGVPGRAELVAYYAELTGRDVSHFRWFQVLACFRLAALLEGSYVRALQGRMPEAMGDGLHTYAGWLWKKAEQEVALG